VRFSFLNPPDIEGRLYMKELGRCGRLSAAGELWPQTGLASLAAVARQSGASVQLLDAMALRWTPSQTAQCIRAFQPDVLFVHVSTPTFNSDRDFCAELIREVPNAVLVVVGSHGSALGAEMLKDFPADYVLVGEGEQPIRQLAESATNCLMPVGHFRGSARADTQDVSTLPTGLRWLDSEGGALSSGDTGFLLNLDELPFPARDLLPNNRYRMPFFGRESFATLISSRGCPYGCSFCRAGVSWGKRVRTRSVPNVIEELRHLSEQHHIRNVVFMTDSFTFDRQWVLDLCEAMDRDVPGLRWICNSRVDAVDEEILAAMKKAGCLLISYGLESGSQSILDSCRKGISLDDSRRAIHLTRRAGILAFGYFILGLPEETWETVRQTIDFALDVEPDYALFHIATPFPGTRLFDEAVEKGLLLNQDWDLCDEETAGILRTVALSAEDLAKARRIAMREFYLRPKVIARELTRTASVGSIVSRTEAAARMLLNWAGKKHPCKGLTR